MSASPKISSKGAPKYDRNSEWDWSDRNRDKDVYDYYRAQLWY